MPKKNSKSLYCAALALFLGGLGYLVFLGFSEGSVYFLNVSEALAMPQDKPQSARLFGTVKAEGLSKLEEGVGVRFQLEDKDNAGQSIWVVYNGVVPPAFKPGAEVIVEGRYNGRAADFQAKMLTTQCPSKYEKKNREPNKT